MKKRGTQTLLLANVFPVQTCCKCFNSVSSEEWLHSPSSNNAPPLPGAARADRLFGFHTQIPCATARALLSNILLPSFVHQPPHTSGPQTQALTFPGATSLLPHPVPIPPSLVSPPHEHHFLSQNQLLSLNPPLRSPLPFPVCSPLQPGIAHFLSCTSVKLKKTSSKI